MSHSTQKIGIQSVHSLDAVGRESDAPADVAVGLDLLDLARSPVGERQIVRFAVAVGIQRQLERNPQLGIASVISLERIGIVGRVIVPGILDQFSGILFFFTGNRIAAGPFAHCDGPLIAAGTPIHSFTSSLACPVLAPLRSLST